MIDRIIKLLDKAASTTFGPEADLLNAKALELIAKYGLEDAMRNAKLPLNQRAEIEVWECIAKNPYATDKATLITNLAFTLRCKSVCQRLTKGNQEVKVITFGFPSDLDRLELLVTSLITQMISGVGIAIVPSNEHAKTYRKSWAMSFINTIIGRVRNAEKKEEDISTPGTSLVLRDRSLEVKNAFEKAFPNTVQSRRKIPKSQGYVDGNKAAHKANIGQKQLS